MTKCIRISCLSTEQLILLERGQTVEERMGIRSVGKQESEGTGLIWQKTRLLVKAL